MTASAAMAVAVVTLGVAEHKPTQPLELTVIPALETSFVPEVQTHTFPDPTTLSFVDEASESQLWSDEEVDESELHWLAKGIYFEARSEPMAGQIKVAAVILNRKADRRWPKTIEAVVRDGEHRLNRCQFSFMCDGKPETVNDRRAWNQAVAAATKALRFKKSGIDLGCAHSYHADYVTSERALRWFKRLRPEEQVGTHVFYCDT